MNKLEVIVKEQELSKDDMQKMAEAFGAPFEEAGVVLSTYKDIKVTDSKDTANMNKAREMRLTLKKARTTVENNRKALKADIVKQGRAIDTIARYVKEEIEPAEEYLQLQEDFAKIEAETKALKIKNDRIEKLMQYTDDISLYNLDIMTPEQFESLLTTLKAQKEAEEKAVADQLKKAEAERKAEEKRIADQAKENARLKAEAVKAEKAREAERKVEAEKQAKVEAEAKLEREKREALEAETHRIVEEQNAKQAEIDAKEIADREAKDKAEREALLSPDKDKLIAFADKLIHIELPMVKSKEAMDILAQIENAVTNLSNGIKNKAKEL